jgi:DNA-binding NtrC family response regulator
VRAVSTLKREYAKTPETAAHAPQTPGVLLVFSGSGPAWAAIPLTEGQLEIGREALREHIQDPSLSRRHARINFLGGRFLVEDLASSNGSWIDGRRLEPRRPQTGEHVVRTGDSLWVLCPDITLYSNTQLTVQEDRVIGPLLQRAFQSITRLGRYSDVLHIVGESGSGKEAAARAFHAASPCSQGPLIAINCAAIPDGVAERLLFGAKRGAFSGAVADAQGYIQAADKGTLFLDEVADLDSAVQAKLLRVLETKEVLALGASTPRAVDVRVCSATHKDLRAQVQQGRLREDLYYRIGKPVVRIPPLRERLEEIPWLIDIELHRARPLIQADTAFVAACLLRAWPGNVRELRKEVRVAVQEALASGVEQVTVAHLSPTAGFMLEKPVTPVDSLVSPPALTDPAPARRREEIEAALRRENGNLSRSAQRLGLHRTQLRRLIDQLGISLSGFPPKRGRPRSESK